MGLSVTGTGAGGWDMWKMRWLIEVFRKDIVPGLCLMVPLIAVQRINCRVVRTEALRLVRRPFWWGRVVVAESERWRVILGLF